MSEKIVGKYFLGKDPARHVDYVWGRILRDLGKGKVECGFFQWEPETTESECFRAPITRVQMNGWHFYPTTHALNAAVADLSRSLATVAQYDCPRIPAKRESGRKTPATSAQR